MQCATVKHKARIVGCSVLGCLRLIRSKDSIVRCSETIFDFIKCKQVVGIVDQLGYLTMAMSSWLSVLPDRLSQYDGLKSSMD